MAKNSMILSVSIPVELANFLDEQNLSPSELLQDKIREVKLVFDKYNNDAGKILRVRDQLEALLQEKNAFLDYAGLTESFIKWRNSDVLAK